MLNSDLQELKDSINYTVGYMESWLKQTLESIDSKYFTSGELLQLKSQKDRLDDLLPRLRNAAKIANLTEELK